MKVSRRSALSEGSEAALLISSAERASILSGSFHVPPVTVLTRSE